MCLFTPLMCIKGGIGLLILARVVQGIFSGLAFPSINDVYSKWAPPNERSRFASIGISGKNIFNLRHLKYYFSQKEFMLEQSLQIF